MKNNCARALTLTLAATFNFACLPAAAEALVVTTDRMFDARAGKITGPAGWWFATD